jgi:TolA-binding protein
VAAKLEQAEGYVSRYGAGGPAPSADEAPVAATSPGRAAAATSAATAGPDEAPLSDVAKQYYNAVSLVSQEKYVEAYKEFKRLLDKGADAEYAGKAEFEMARCLYYLKQYDGCIKGFTAIVQRAPKHPDLREALFFIGRSYEEKGDKARAGSLYKKILSMGEDDPVARRARKALRTMEGGEA